jgi:hypothetical protein
MNSSVRLKEGLQHQKDYVNSYVRDFGLGLLLHSDIHCWYLSPEMLF